MRHAAEAIGARSGEAGFISLVTVLVMAAAAVAIGLSFSTWSLSEQQHAYFDESSSESLYASDSCVEEAFIRLKRNPAYAGGTVSVGDGSCSVAVTAAGSLRTIVASSTVRGFSRKIVATTTMQGATFRYTDWEEYAGF